MPDYKIIADMLDVLDRHSVSERDEMLSYLLKMAREHSVAARPHANDLRARNPKISLVA